MNPLPHSFFHHNDLLCFPSHDDDSRWYFVPGEPTPNSNGIAPSWQVISGGVQLSLSACWFDTTTDQTASLKQAIRERTKKSPADFIDVQVVPPSMIEIGGMHLILVDKNREHVLASSKTSGFAPWNAVFSFFIDAPEATLVLAALEDGLTNRLLLTMRYALRVPQSADVQISGTIPAPSVDLLTILSADNADSVACTLVEDCLKRKNLKERLHTTLTDDTPLVQETRQQAIAQACLITACSLVEQAEQYAVAQKSAASKNNSSWISKTFGSKPTTTTVTFKSTPIDLDAQAKQTETFRIPSSTSLDTWLSATTDLGIWSATHLSIKGA